MDSNELGIRDLISDTISEFEFEKNEIVKKLITDFNIKELIVTTLKNSKLSFEIDLSSIDYLPKEYFVGRITWSSIYEEMKRLLDEEGVSLTIHTKKIGGCCPNPVLRERWKCNGCGSLQNSKQDRCINGCQIKNHIGQFDYASVYVDSKSCPSCELEYQAFENIGFDKLSAHITWK